MTNVSPNFCWATFWKLPADSVFTFRYQWPTSRAYASFTSAGTWLVAVA